jgi:DNA-binding NarL/FixJ family response regulator
MPFERARTLTVSGAVERRLRHRARARTLLEEAASEFTRMGARLWAKRAGDELARLGGRQARKAGALTPAETRVAELAAKGLSNKEIAQHLYLSVHTVELHLSHAYAKLGIRSRAALAGSLPG